MQQGISHLQQIVEESTSRIKVKNNHIPLFSLIQQLITTMREYIQQIDFKGSWIDWIVKDKKSNSLFLLLCNYFNS